MSFLKRSAGIILLVALLFGFAQGHGSWLPATESPKSIAVQAQAPAPFPVVHAYVLDEDVSHVPAEFASYEEIDRTDIPSTFDWSAEQDEDAHFLFMSRDLLLSATQTGDTFLYEELWQSVLQNGHGVFVFDAPALEVAETLDLKISTAGDDTSSDEVAHIGVGIQKYRVSTIGGALCPLSSGFATFEFASHGILMDEETGDISYDLVPDYAVAHALVGMLAAETIDQSAAEIEEMSAKAALSEKVTLASTYARIFPNKFGLETINGTNYHTCAWGLRGWITKFYSTSQEEWCDWRPLITNPPPPIEWGVQASMFTFGSAHRYRPNAAGEWENIGDICDESDDGLLGYKEQTRIAAGGANTLALSTQPENSVLGDTTVDVTLGIGVPAGVYGEASWSFDQQGVELHNFSNDPVSGDTQWERRLSLGLMLQGVACGATPSYESVINARGTAGHLRTRSSPGETWLVAPPVSSPSGDEFSLQLDMGIHVVGFRKALLWGHPARRMSDCYVESKPVTVVMVPGGRVELLPICPPEIPGPYRDPEEDECPAPTPSPGLPTETPTAGAPTRTATPDTSVPTPTPFGWEPSPSPPPPSYP